MKLQATLNSICNKANDIALSHAQAHRLHRKKRKEEDQIENAEVKVGGCFGKVTGTPSTKKSRCLELHSFSKETFHKQNIFLLFTHQWIVLKYKIMLVLQVVTMLKLC